MAVTAQLFGGIYGFIIFVTKYNMDYEIPHKRIDFLLSDDIPDGRL